MRRHYLLWAIGVFGIVGTVYGLYSLVYNLNHGKGLSILALLLFIFGLISLILYLLINISKRLAAKKRIEEPVVKEEIIEDKVDTTKIEEKPTEVQALEEPKEKEEVEEEHEEIPRGYGARSDTSYEPYRESYASTSYVKEVGYGPLLRVSGSMILDMRSNTYYRIEGNNVYQDGYGIRFEIRGNQIRDVFGSYLYEISGSNINKVFGGFYASISGNYITLYDSSRKFEMTDSLSKKQILVAIALLF